jgi:hypothetical protein
VVGSAFLKENHCCNIIPVCNVVSANLMQGVVEPAWMGVAQRRAPEKWIDENQIHSWWFRKNDSLFVFREDDHSAQPEPVCGNRSSALPSLKNAFRRPICDFPLLAFVYVVVY